MLNQTLYGRSLTLSLSLGISDVKGRAVKYGAEEAALQWDWHGVKEVLSFPGQHRLCDWGLTWKGL